MMPRFLFYCSFTILVLLASAFARFPATAGILVLVSVYALIWQKPALKRLVRIPILIFVGIVLLTAFITPSFLGVQDFSSPHLRLIYAADVAMKGVMILLVIQIFATRISVSVLTHFTEKLGIKGFGFVLGVALHLLPALHRHARTSRRAMAIRGAFRKNRLQAEYRWVLAIMKWMLRQGDLICVSARIRGTKL